MSRAGRSIEGGENQVWVGVGQGSLFWGVSSKDGEPGGGGRRWHGCAGSQAPIWLPYQALHSLACHIGM